MEWFKKIRDRGGSTILAGLSRSYLFTESSVTNTEPSINNVAPFAPVRSEPLVRCEIKDKNSLKLAVPPVHLYTINGGLIYG